MFGISKIPPKPGVYIFRDQQGSALYVGKALNLKNRVRSYFLSKAKNARFSSEAMGPKTAAMVSKIAKIEHIVVESEIEALLLESDLIKRLKPKYNVQLTDDKNYKYIKITKVKSQKSKPMSDVKTVRSEEFPKISTSRTTDDKSAKYFGPFPEGDTVKQVLRTLRRIFPFRDCSEAKFKRYQKLGRSCLYGDLKLCLAPCVGRISSTDYQRIILQSRSFLEGKSKKVIRDLQKEMKSYSKSKEFERAAAIRNRIRNLEYVTQEFRPSKDYLKHPDLLEDQRQKEMEELRKRVEIEKLERIEAYDISNIFGQWAVGSMVVFINGEPDKSQYRRFKIKTVAGINDVGMIKEVLKRRLARITSRISAGEPFAEIPDLILIDGGKSQVSAVNEVLRESGLRIPVLGLAKRFEEIVASDFSIIKLPKHSPALHLLQRIRNEAHRFALSYHKKLRSKSLWA